MCKSFEEAVSQERSRGCKHCFCDHMLHFMGNLWFRCQIAVDSPFVLSFPSFPVRSPQQPLLGLTDLWNETQCCHQVVANYYYTSLYPKFFGLVLTWFTLKSAFGCCQSNSQLCNVFVMTFSFYTHS